MNAEELRIERRVILEAVQQHNEVEIIGPLMARKYVIDKLLENEQVKEQS